MKSSRTTRQIHKRPKQFFEGDLVVDDKGNVFLFTRNGYLCLYSEEAYYKLGISYQFEQSYLHLSVFKGKVTLQND